MAVSACCAALAVRCPKTSPRPPQGTMSLPPPVGLTLPFGTVPQAQSVGQTADGHTIGDPLSQAPCSASGSRLNVETFDSAQGSHYRRDGFDNCEMLLRRDGSHCPGEDTRHGGDCDALPATVPVVEFRR